MKALILPLFLLITSHSIFACDCAINNVKTDFKQHETVFTGTVITSHAFFSSGKDNLHTMVTIAVSKTFKGEPVDTIQIRTGIGGADCAFHFNEGEEYLVFASNFAMYTDDGEKMLETTICTNSGLSRNKIVALATLEELLKEEN
jgi:hypothetical protein